MTSIKRISRLARLISALSCVLACSLSYGQNLFPSASTRMIAGQNIDVGQVTCGHVSGSRTDGFCHVRLEGGWCMNIAHLYIGDQIPVSMSPGQFPFQSRPPACATSWSLPFKFAVSSGCSRPVSIIALHAEVSRSNNNQQETAWGQGTRTGQNWSMVFGLPCVPDPT
jgi:hypothetical protein